MRNTVLRTHRRRHSLRQTGKLVLLMNYRFMVLGVVTLCISCSRSLQIGTYANKESSYSQEYSWFTFSHNNRFEQNKSSDQPPFNDRRTGEYSIKKGKINLMYSCDQRPPFLKQLTRLSEIESKNFILDITNNFKNIYAADSVFIQVNGAKNIEIFKGKVDSTSFSVDVPLNPIIQPFEIIFWHRTMWKSTYLDSTKVGSIHLEYCNGHLYPDGVVNKQYKIVIRKEHIKINGYKYYLIKSE